MNMREKTRNIINLIPRFNQWERKKNYPNAYTYKHLTHIKIKTKNIRTQKKKDILKRVEYDNQINKETVSYTYTW